MLNRIEEAFNNKFGYSEGIVSSFCPLPFVLLGEFNRISLSCTFNIGCCGGIRLRDDDIIRIYDLSYGVVIEDKLSLYSTYMEYTLLNHVKSVLWSLKEKGYSINKGFDMVLFRGEIEDIYLIPPMGSLITHLLCIVNSFNIGSIEASIISHYSEIVLLNIENRLEDYLYVFLSRRDRALILNKVSLEYIYVPFILKSHNIVLYRDKGIVPYKNIFRERLFSIKSPEEYIRRYKNIDSIEDLTPYEFNTFEHILDNEDEREALRYIVCEGYRLKEACDALRSHDIDVFLCILKESRESFNYLTDGSKGSCDYQNLGFLDSSFKVSFIKESHHIEGLNVHTDYMRVKIN